MQRLVYILIALAGLGIGVAAYFGFTFSVIEAFVTALAFGAIAVMLMERRLRRRAEAELQDAVDDLGRVLATNAQTNSALGDRLNAMAVDDSRQRIEALEADIGVLGGVVRQLAEALSELQAARAQEATPQTAAPAPVVAAVQDELQFLDPVIPLELLRQAMADNRLICHIQPIILLPQRKPHGYSIVPRLMLEDGELADAPDFMPRRGGADVIREIEATLLAEAVVIARRARTAGVPVALYFAVSRSTLGDPAAIQQLLATLEANRAIGPYLVFSVTQADFSALTRPERAALSAMSKTGIGFSLAGATNLRIDFADLQGLGFRSIRIDGPQFIGWPERFTDFHASDVAAYGRRYNIEIIGTNVADEQQVMSLFEDGIALVQGPHIGGPGPVRSDLMLERVVAGVAPRRAGA